MKRVKVLEKIENEFVEQLRLMLRNSFPLLIKFDVDYFIGEENGNRAIYLVIVSSPIGPIYQKRQFLKSHELVADVQEDFLDAAMNDLVLAGISFLTNETVKQKEGEQLDALIRAKKFVNKMPPKIYLN